MFAGRRFFIYTCKRKRQPRGSFSRRQFLRRYSVSAGVYADFEIREYDPDEPPFLEAAAKERPPSPHELNLVEGPNDRTIFLTRGYWTLVSAEEYDALCCFLWHVKIQPSGIYAVRNGRKSEGALHRKTIYMHRQIAGALQSPDIEVDHKNGCGLDNRNDNLRIGTHDENMQNFSAFWGTMPYRGVYRRSTKHGSWRYIAEITFRYKRYKLGSFDTAEEAARAYDRKALELLGHLSRHILENRMNFPDEVLPPLSEDDRSRGTSHSVIADGDIPF